MALIGVLAFYILTVDASASPDSEAFVGVALNAFNASAISCLLFILAAKEKSSAEQFGQVMRDNISTVVVALFINLITTVHVLLVKFGILTVV